jgi:hypothetical protein
LTAFVLAVSARIEARLRESRRCLEMLDEAERELAGHDGAEADPAWLSVFDESALAGHRGSCLLDLNLPRHAVDRLREEEAAAPDMFVRNRAIWLLDRADAHLALNDAEEACAEIQQAWNVAAGTMSRRIHQRLVATASALVRRDPSPRVNHLRENLRAAFPEAMNSATAS